MGLAFVEVLLLLGYCLLHWLVPGERSRYGVCVAVLLVVLLVFPFLLNRIMPLEQRFYGAPSVSMAYSAYQKFKTIRPELETHPESLLVLVEGSSFTVHGLKGELLVRRLASIYSVPVHAIQLSLSGAHHTERQAIARMFLARLSLDEKEVLKNTQVLFLREVSGYYDLAPLTSQYDRNLFSDRVVAYLRPANLSYVMDGFLANGDAAFLSREAVNITKHTLLHLYGTGLMPFGKPVPERNMRHRDAYQPYFQPDEKFDFQKALAREWKPIAVPGWLGERDAYFERLWRPYADTLIDYGMPTLRQDLADYQIDYCHQFQAKHPCIPANDPALLGMLRVPGYWHDIMHMLDSGATLYTKWLAGKVGSIFHPEAGTSESIERVLNDAV